MHSQSLIRGGLEVGEGECERGACVRRAEQGSGHRAVGVQSRGWAGTVPMDKVGLQTIFGMRFGETLNCLYPNIYLDDY